MKIDAGKLRAFVKSHGLTNTKLAAQAGITRQALQSMLKEGHVVDVRERTARGLAQALRLPDESLLSPDPLAGYKQAVADEHVDLTFRGLGLPTTESRFMDDLYVPILSVRLPDQDHDDCKPLRSGIDGESSMEATIKEADKLTVAECLDFKRRVLIRGDPGSGKTTALRHAARIHAQGHVAATGPRSKQFRVPLMVRLADFAKARERDGNMTLVRFVVTRALRDAPPEFWTRVEHNLEIELKKGACLILLDGLDEAGADSGLVAVLRSFVKDFDQNQFVLTSRIVGLDTGPWHELGFAMFKTAPWSEEEIREFARRWHAGRPTPGRKQPKKQLDQRADEFTKVILGHRPLREIASNPLMLTILAALHHANATLPRRRVDLYAKIVEVMLETWEASKREARPGDPLHGIALDAREFGWLLARLALGMQREGRILRPRWWVNDSVQQFLREMAIEEDIAKEQGDQVIRYLCERTGLLVERGDGVFGFCHRTFQEYFAARGLMLAAEGGGDMVALLRPHLFHPQWEEVVVHAAASLAAPRATSLLRVILDDPDPAGRFLRRSQRLALRCLVDGTAVADRALLDQIFADGDAIGGSRWLGITIEFLGLLKQLRVTKHEAEAQRMLRDIEEAAKAKLPSDDYIAVYFSLHEPPDGPKNGEPGTICTKRLGGRAVQLIWPDWRLRLKDPDTWFAKVFHSMIDSKKEARSRVALASFLKGDVDSNENARQVLRKLLVRDRLPEIRAACADALAEATTVDPSVVKLLLDQLRKDKSELVRERCAEALRRVAPLQAEVKCRLEELLSSGPDRVRAGAATGLSRLEFTSPDQRALLDRFLAIIVAPTEPAPVRCASIGAIASLVGQEAMASVDHAMEQCLDDQNTTVRDHALHALAGAIAEGRRDWSQNLVGKIESMLMAVAAPCPHLHGDLVTIVALREVRRLDRLLTDALKPLLDHIRIAFIFGSVARQEQNRDSDIDLMIVGEARLKEVAAALHAPEQSLGRAVNPVLFSPERFREQYREGNPFLVDVVRKEKVFLKGSRDELTELVADRSAD